MSLAWSLFTHYLFSRRAGAVIRTVTWLSMSGVAIGVTSLVVVLSVMNGFNDAIRKRLFAAEPHMIVQIEKLRTTAELEATDIFRDLKVRSDVRTDSFEAQDVILRTVDGTFGGAVARGVESGALRYLIDETRKINATANSARERKAESSPELASETYELSEGEVILGIDLARGLGIFEGDSLTVVAPEALILPAGEAPPFVKVKVKSLLTTNIADVDSKTIYYGKGKTFYALQNSPSRSVGIELRLNKPEEFIGLQRELQARGAKVESWVERNSSLFYALRLEKLAIGTFLSLSALIASFSIVTVLYLLMTQKRKDIGLMMGLGLSPSKTRTLFLQIGLLLSGFGIGSGLIGGVLISLLIADNPLPLLPDIYVDATIPARLDPWFLFMILLVASVVAVLSSWLPAHALTRETPSEALRSQRRTRAAHR